MITTRIITDIRELSALQPDWDSLVVEAGQSVFATTAWLLTWWQVFGRGKRLFVVLAEENGKLLGLAPLMISRLSLFDFKLRKVEFIGSGNIDYGNFIVKDKPEEVICALLKCLHQQQDQWDIIELTELPESARVLRHQIAGYKVVKKTKSVCPFMNLSEFDEASLEQSFKKSMRTDIRRQSKRLNQLGQLRLELNIGREKLPQFLKDFFQLYDQRWHSVGLPGKFNRPNYREFFTQIASNLSANGWCRLAAMYLNDELIAAHFGFVYQLKFYYYVPTFSIKYANYSPGKVLLFNLIKDSLCQGLKFFDFLRGDESYKTSWPVEIKYTCRLILFKQNFYSYWLYFWVIHLRPWLQKFSVISKIKAGLTVKE